MSRTRNPTHRAKTLSIPSQRKDLDSLRTLACADRLPSGFADSPRLIEHVAAGTSPAEQVPALSCDQIVSLDDQQSPHSGDGDPVTLVGDAAWFTSDLLGQGEDGLDDFASGAFAQLTAPGSTDLRDFDDRQNMVQHHQVEPTHIDGSAFPAEAFDHADSFPPVNQVHEDVTRRISDMYLRLNPWADAALITPPDRGVQQESLLRRYDTDLCVLPLTHDSAVNPFRVRGFDTENSQLLLQCILALSFQHQVNIGTSQTSEALEHRLRASELLAGVLKNGKLRNRDDCVLASILILITLDCTISASGNWSGHIGKAVAVLEAWGGVDALKSPRIRSQVGMLVWWDATLALMSRLGTLFPVPYFECLVANEEQDGWSFFALTGCPTELLVYLRRLVEMARQKELASSMEFLTFEMKPVFDTEKDILCWRNVFTKPGDCGPRQGSSDRIQEEFCNIGADSSEDTASPDSDNDDEEYCQQQDRHHLAEAWRYGLLLYIQRVFRWDRQSHRRPPDALRLTSRILEHSRNCRKTSQAQKQLLLPIFLAGAEARDEDMRDTARSFCLWWGARCRYGMFYSVLELLEEYWRELPSRKGQAFWWGSFLDMKSASGSARGSNMQFLFG